MSYYSPVVVFPPVVRRAPEYDVCVYCGTELSFDESDVCVDCLGEGGR